MAQPTVSESIIILRKTKLGEADLIITGLAEDGSQVRCVAKGARKPSSSFASRLELYSVAQVTMAPTKSLHIIREARLIDAHDAVRSSMEASVAAAPCMELLDRISQPDLPVPRLFDLTTTALSAMGSVTSPMLPVLSAAHMLKALGIIGLRPHLKSCVGCGTSRSEFTDDRVRFSVTEGGVVCSNCCADIEYQTADGTVLDWIDVLIGLTFDRITEIDPADVPVYDILQFIKAWVRQHVNVNLKSLDFMLTFVV